jgi:hypothetical protein
MKVMAQLVNKPVPDPDDFPDLGHWPALKMSDTFPSLRDALEEDTTAFVEEGEAYDKKNERLIADRYSRQTAVVRYKKEEIVGHSQAGAHIFGATVIHKRRGYKDPATTSRSIFVTTKQEENKSHSDTIFTDKEREEFRNMAKQIDVYPLTHDTRADDLWCPLIGLGINAGGGEWVVWANEQRQKRAKRAGSEGSFDPQKAVILGVISKVFSEDGNDNLTFLPGKYELPPIQRNIEQNSGLQLSVNEIKIGLELQDFEVKQRKGVFRVNVTADKLKKACADLGIQDEAVSAIP